jgi:hypothetical protein
MQTTIWSSFWQATSTLAPAFAMLAGMGLSAASVQAGPADKSAMGGVTVANVHTNAGNADANSSVFIPGSLAAVNPVAVAPAAAPSPSAMDMRRQEMRNAFSAKPGSKPVGDASRRLSLEERVQLRAQLRQDLRAQEDGAVAKR